MDFYTFESYPNIWQAFSVRTISHIFQTTPNINYFSYNYHILYKLVIQIQPGTGCEGKKSEIKLNINSFLATNAFHTIMERYDEKEAQTSAESFINKFEVSHYQIKQKIKIVCKIISFLTTYISFGMMVIKNLLELMVMRMDLVIISLFKIFIVELVISSRKMKSVWFIIFRKLIL